MNAALYSLASAVQLADVVRLVNEIEQGAPFGASCSFGCSANVTIDQMGVFLKKHGLLNRRDVRVSMGALDSHIENMQLFRKEGLEHVFLLNFFDALVPSFESRVSHLPPEFISSLLETVRSQLGIVLGEAKTFKTVFLPLFHRFSHPVSLDTSDPVDLVIAEFNEMIRTVAKEFANVKTIDPALLAAELGDAATFNRRFYYTFKSPYAVGFMDELARNLLGLLRGGGAYYYKALVLDCDNTLWGGIVGEDQLGGIKLGPHDYPGKVFWSIQNEILGLKKKGVLLALCSKNNARDVDEVLSKHPDTVLKDEHLVLKKVNWSDKVDNLKEIAAELNIGLDSLVFLDDSEFECNAIRAQLPQVKVIQVPKNIFEYPRVFRQVKELFSSIEQSKASGDKTEQYQIRARAIEQQAKFANQEDYLKSLGIQVTLRKNYAPAVARISELTQKSNQFNVTTRRYSESEILALFAAPDAAVYSLDVQDKFGDSGLTGIAIVRYAGKELVVDSFLMSCRVIGRGVEFAVWESICADAVKRGCTHISSEYLKSAKNSLVIDFFDKLGLTLTESSEQLKRYRSPLSALPPAKQAHVEVRYEESR